MFVFVFLTTQLSIGKLQQLHCNLTEMMEIIPGHGLNSDSWIINQLNNGYPKWNEEWIIIISPELG